VTKTLYLEKLQNIIYNQLNIEGCNWKKFNYTKRSKRKGILIKTMKIKIERKFFLLKGEIEKNQFNKRTKKIKRTRIKLKKNHKLWFENEIKNKL